jgi:hypothetical protein
MANSNEPGRSAGTSAPPTEVIPPSERRADKGFRKLGFWAIVIGGLLLGIAAVALEWARPAENDQAGRNPPQSDAGAVSPR